MKKITHIIISSILLSGIITFNANSQQLVDAVTVIIGNEIILLSEIESLVLTQRSMGDKTPVNKLRCEILEDLMIQKLFLDQARIDSIIITQDEVDRSLNMRINDFVMRAGSEKNLEDYYNKSMIEIKRDLRKMMENEILTQQMQQSLARDITTTPAEVRRFFNRIKDSIPLIPAKVQISIIQMDPPDNEINILEVRQKLLNLRRRIIEGESFRALAILYSEDEGSATRGGEIGFLPRSNLDNAYADEAFSLKKNSVSRIVESEFGFHIIELIDRNGDMINTRHILMKTKVKPGQVTEALNRLDSISDLIRKDSLSFELTALKYSTDKDSRLNGGKFVTNDTRENLIEIDKLPPDTYRVVRDLKIGEISNAFKTKDLKGNTVFMTVRLDSRTEPHKANLKIDFNYIQELSLSNKRNDVYRNWITEKMEVTYIKISNEFRTCQFSNKGWLK